jgi:hypothetical protein
MDKPASHYTRQNKRAIDAQEAIIEKLGYGVLNVEVEFHNKRVVKQTFYGKERKKYNKENYEDALKDMLKRVKQSMDRKESTEIVFQVNIRQGRPEQVLWLSNHTINYDVDNSPQNVQDSSITK